MLPSGSLSARSKNLFLYFLSYAMWTMMSTSGMVSRGSLIPSMVFCYAVECAAFTIMRMTRFLVPDFPDCISRLSMRFGMSPICGIMNLASHSESSLPSQIDWGSMPMRGPSSPNGDSPYARSSTSTSLYSDISCCRVKAMRFLFLMITFAF